MKLKILLALLLAQAAPQPKGPEKATVTTKIQDVVSAGTKVERIWTTTTTSADGLIAAPDGTLLLPQQAANTISKVDKDGKLTVFLQDTNGGGGLAIDSRGRYITVERTMPRVRVLLPEPRKVLVDAYEGKPLEGASDIVADSKGGIYFTEGRMTPPSSAVYYINSTGRVIRILSNVERANGIELSPDGKALYIADTPGQFVLAFEVLADGSVNKGRNFAKLADGQQRGADGLTIDADGRVYVATNVGIQVFDRHGQYLGTIPSPRQVTTLAFAGPDKKTLYFIGRGTDGAGGDGPNARSLYKVSMQAQGFKGRAK
jgi:gluconolactonase